MNRKSFADIYAFHVKRTHPNRPLTHIRTQCVCDHDNRLFIIHAVLINHARDVAHLYKRSIEVVHIARAAQYNNAIYDVLDVTRRCATRQFDVFSHSIIIFVIMNCRARMCTALYIIYTHVII